MSKDRKIEKTKLENFSFKKYAWNQFKKNKPAKFSLYLLILKSIVQEKSKCTGKHIIVGKRKGTE